MKSVYVLKRSLPRIRSGTVLGIFSSRALADAAMESVIASEVKAERSRSPGGLSAREVESIFRRFLTVEPFRLDRLRKIHG